jgi:hypothetical protein
MSLWLQILFGYSSLSDKRVNPPHPQLRELKIYFQYAAQQIGIFGGTFAPPHLILASEAQSQGEITQRSNNSQVLGYQINY